MKNITVKSLLLATLLSGPVAANDCVECNSYSVFIHGWYWDAKNKQTQKMGWNASPTGSAGRLASFQDLEQCEKFKNWAVEQEIERAKATKTKVIIQGYCQAHFIEKPNWELEEAI